MVDSRCPRGNKVIEAIMVPLIKGRARRYQVEEAPGDGIVGVHQHAQAFQIPVSEHRAC